MLMLNVIKLTHIQCSQMLKRIQRQNEKSKSFQAKKKNANIANSSSAQESSSQFANENELTEQSLEPDHQSAFSDDTEMNMDEDLEDEEQRKC